MGDFNDYVKDNGNKKKDNGGNIFDYVKSFASKYDGKNASELLDAIKVEATKRKKNGTLSNADLDNFSKTLSPFLDDKKQKILDKIIKELKEI